MSKTQKVSLMATRTRCRDPSKGIICTFSMLLFISTLVIRVNGSRHGISMYAMCNEHI